MVDAWQKTSQLFFDQAAQKFNDPGISSAEQKREAAYGQALTLLQAQPASENNVLQAISLLHNIVAVREDDELGLAAQYSLAYIEELDHDDIGLSNLPNRLKEAKRLYQALAQKHPESYYGQLAFIRYATLDIYELGPLKDKPAVLSRLETESVMLKDPALQSLFHQNMSFAYARLEVSTEKAYEHLLAAARLGIIGRTIQADAYVRLVHWAIQLGHPDVAREFNDHFQKEYPADNRCYLLHEQITALGSVAQI